LLGKNFVVDRINSQPDESPSTIEDGVQMKSDFPLLECDQTGDAARSNHIVRSRLTKPVSEIIFCDWMATARVGEVFEYHRGFLTVDRSETHSRLGPKERAMLHAVARRAWIACEMGIVHLVSQRITDQCYRYLAVKAVSKLTTPEIRHRLRTSKSFHLSAH
jgi:hypothetical protein